MTLRIIANGVIVAENDALVRAIIRSVLVGADQQVFPAADGLEALDLARQFKARLVLLDIGMPRFNGLEACKAIRLCRTMPTCRSLCSPAMTRSGCGWQRFGPALRLHH